MTIPGKSRSWEERRAMMAAKAAAITPDPSQAPSPLVGTAPGFVRSASSTWEALDPKKRADWVNRKACIPSLFQTDPTFSDHPWWRTKDEVLALMLAGKNACLVGPCGVGKTTMACTILRAMSSGRTSAYETALDMSSKVRATYAKGSRQTERDILVRYKTCELLVIDDWQWLGAPEKGHKIFFDVVDTRHRNERPTLVIMNVPTSEIAHHLGPQITSRIARRGEIIACRWPKFGEPE